MVYVDNKYYFSARFMRKKLIMEIALKSGDVGRGGNFN